MKKFIPLIKHIIYFIIGFFIFTSIFFIVNIYFFKSVDFYIDIKKGILETAKSISLLYTSLYLLVVTINALYNTIIINKLNKETENIRNIEKENKNKEIKSKNYKKKILKTIFLVSMVFIGIYLAINLREAFIIYKCSEKQLEVQNETNFYIKSQIIHGNKVVEESEIYRKGNKSIETRKTEESPIKTYIDKDIGMWDFLEYENGRKVVRIFGDEFFANNMIPIFTGAGSFKEEKMTFGEAFELAVQRKIITEKVNNYDCYKIEISNSQIIWANKKDYIKIKEINGKTVNNKMERVLMGTEILDYSINEVKEEDVKLPSFDGYEVEDVTDMFKELINKSQN